MIAKMPVKAQYVLLEADKAYALYNYNKAIDLYEQAYKKKATLHAAERLAASYLKQKNYGLAECWYAIAAAMPGSNALNTRYYAEALQNNSKYGEAIVQFKKYIDLDKNISQDLEKKWLLSCDSAIVWMRNPLSVQIVNQKNINSPESDFAAVDLNGTLVFTSDKTISEKSKSDNKRPFLKLDDAKLPMSNIYGWTGNHYLRLYQADKTNNVTLFPVDADTEYHIGSASFNGDGTEMYFALTKIANDLDYVKVKELKGKLATVQIGIYHSKKDAADKWSKPKAFIYNLDHASFGDPFITSNGKQLYFSSDMPGGKGGTDIYVTEKTNDGHWGIPKNMEEINTAGNERTPFVDEQNNFYFSTDGRIGMGGLDVFCAKLLNSNKMMQPVNLHYPFNSPQDDFAYFIKDKAGFLSSNRLHGIGNDDVYHFSIIKDPVFRLTGYVFDKATGLPLANAIVTLNQNNGNVLKVETGTDGFFSFKLERESDYKLISNKSSYLSDSGGVSTKNLDTSAVLRKDLYLKKIELEKAIRLENIYYDFDKADIRADAKPELDKLVKIMQDNPSIWIELGSHTDSRGNDAYNLDLSQRRADSAVAYIISKGIGKNRIEARGYGERKPVNTCVNGVKCSEAAHQLNRRTEFKIIKE